MIDHTTALYCTVDGLLKAVGHTDDCRRAMTAPEVLTTAVDRQGLTVDFLLSEHRDIAAAKRFFTRAIEQYGTLITDFPMAPLLSP